MMCHYLDDAGDGPDYEGGETREEWAANMAEIEMAKQARAEEQADSATPWDVNPEGYEALP